jgi:hypothetical protein
VTQPPRDQARDQVHGQRDVAMAGWADATHRAGSGQTRVVETTGRTVDAGPEPAMATVCVPGGRSANVATP